MMHWTTIDADGDGYNWEMRTNWGNTQNRYCVTSASYDDITGVDLTPENYLVTPYKLDCQYISFDACAQDATAPEEHFGVAVSTTGNTSADDFTIVWETDMTAKTPGNWYHYGVDLRDYQGQDIYVAIVHFNCKGHFMLNVDDIKLVRVWDQVSDLAGAMFTVYPNPAGDQVRVESPVGVDTYELYSVTGALLRCGEVNAKVFDIDLSALPAGTYLIKTRSEGLSQTRRVVKR